MDDDPIHRLIAAVEALREDVREDIRDTRAELRDVRADVRTVGERVDKMDTRVNGRIRRLEDEQARIDRQVGAEMLVAARLQGAAEDREHLGVPASPLPPPVTHTREDQGLPRWVRTLVYLTGGLATAAGGIAAILSATGGTH